MKAPFKFYLRRDATNYLTVIGGAVAERSGATPLEYAPDGWGDVQEVYDRNKEKHGVFTEYSNTYRFVKDGAHILRYILYTYGVSGKCQIEITRLNHTSQLYEPYFIGDMNFMTAVDELSYFSVSLMETGLTELLKTNINTEYSIALADTDPSLIRVNLNSMQARGEATWITTFPPTERAGFPHTAFPPYVDINDYPLTSMVSVDVKQVVAASNVVPITAGNQAVVTDMSFVLKTLAPIYGLQFSGQLTFNVNNASGSSDTFNLRWNITDGATTTQHIVFTGTAAAGAVTTFNVNIALPAPISVAAGYTVTLLANMPGSATIAWDYNWLSGSQVKASWLNYTPDLTLKGLRYFTVFKRLVEKITGNVYTGSSALLTNMSASYGTGYDNRPWDSVITSGDGIRGKSDAVLKITLADLFKDADVRWSVGMDTAGGVCSIERKGNYYDSTSPAIDLGPASEVTIETDSDSIYTHIHIGYPDQVYDEVNGRDEFNGTHVLKLPTLAVSKELDMVTSWRSDMWGIFFVWTKYLVSESKDSASDNHIFVIEIGPTPDTAGKYHALSLFQNTPTTGVTDPANAFNFGFSPKRNLYRNGAYIHSLLYGVENEFITFQTATKNRELRTDLASGVIDEDANVQVSALAPPLYLPFRINAHIATSTDLAAIIRANPYREYFTTCRGITYRGFIMKGAVKGAHRDVFTFNLRASPNNDMSALIRR